MGSTIRTIPYTRISLAAPKETTIAIAFPELDKMVDRLWRSQDIQ